MTEAEEPVEAPLSDTVLCVRYTDTSNFRILSRRDLSGDPAASQYDVLTWTPASEIAWETWLEFAGSEEQARAVLERHSHEFKLVGPGAEEFEVEEFSFEATD